MNKIRRTARTDCEAGIIAANMKCRVLSHLRGVDVYSTTPVFGPISASLASASAPRHYHRCVIRVKIKRQTVQKSSERLKHQTQTNWLLAALFRKRNMVPWRGWLFVAPIRQGVRQTIRKDTRRENSANTRNEPKSEVEVNFRSRCLAVTLLLRRASRLADRSRSTPCITQPLKSRV